MSTVAPPPGMRLPELQKRRPILDALSSRPTIFLRRPIVAELAERLGFQVAVAVPVEIEEVIKEKWGRKLASGIVDKMVAEMERKGVRVSPELREAMIDAWATVVTRGLLR